MRESLSVLIASTFKLKAISGNCIRQDSIYMRYNLRREAPSKASGGFLGIIPLACGAVKGRSHRRFQQLLRASNNRFRREDGLVNLPKFPVLDHQEQALPA